MFFPFRKTVGCARGGVKWRIAPQGKKKLKVFLQKLFSFCDLIKLCPLGLRSTKSLIMKRRLSMMCGAFALLFSFSFASFAQNDGVQPPSFLDGVREGGEVTLVFPSNDASYRLNWVFRLDMGGAPKRWELPAGQNTFRLVGADFTDGLYILTVGGGAYYPLPADLRGVQPDGPLYLFTFHAKDNVIGEVDVERNQAFSFGGGDEPDSEPEPPSFLNGVQEGEVVTLVFPSSDVPYRLVWTLRLDMGGAPKRWELPAGQNTLRLVGTDFADGYYVLSVGGGAYQMPPRETDDLDDPLYVVGFHVGDGVIGRVSVEENGVYTVQPIDGPYVPPSTGPAPGVPACGTPCVEDCKDCEECATAAGACCLSKVMCGISCAEDVLRGLEITGNGSDVVVVTLPSSEVLRALKWFHVVDGFLRANELPVDERLVRIAAADFSDGMHVVAVFGGRGRPRFISFLVEGSTVTVAVNPKLIRRLVRAALRGKACCACCAREIAEEVGRVEVGEVVEERSVKVPVASPNPVTGDRVRMDFPSDAGYRVRVYSPDMRLVYKTRVPEGQTYVQVDVSDLPAGEYIVLTINSRDVVRAVRLLRQ